MNEQTKKAIKKTKESAVKKSKEMKARKEPYLESLAKKLTAPFPKEAEQIKKFKTFSLTGFKPAYIIERLNECFGYKGWHAELIPFDYTVHGQRFDNLVMIEESCVTVWVKLTVVFADDRKPQHHNQFGTCEYHKGSLSVGEAIKGAYTDGLKKCAGYFDIGQEAYKGNVEPYSQPNQGAKRQSFSGGTGSKSEASDTKPGDYARGAEPTRETATGVGSKDKPTEKQVKFLQQHKIEVPKTKEEASKLIGTRFKELNKRKEDTAEKLAGPSSEEQRNEIAHYEEKYPDVLQEVLTGLKLENTNGLTVKGADLVIKRTAQSLKDLGITEGEITKHEV